MVWDHMFLGKALAANRSCAPYLHHGFNILCCDKDFATHCIDIKLCPFIFIFHPHRYNFKNEDRHVVWDW